MLIDQGKIINTIENQIETHPNVIQVNVTDGFQGDSPDIGAYEFGNELWIPGIDFEPVLFIRYSKVSFIVSTFSHPIL